MMRQIVKRLSLLYCFLFVLGYLFLSTNIKYPVKSVYAAENGVTDFVSRLYTEVLGREADEAGLSEWTAYLQNGTFSGVEVASGFIMSDEFLNKDMEHEEFVRIMYSAFFGREANTDELRAWVDYLNQGYRKSFVFSGFANSVEFGNLCASYGVTAGLYPVTITEQQPNLSDEEYNTWLFVERLYTEVLGRTPDMTGIKEWADYLQAGTYTGAEVSKGFIMSTEFQNKTMTNEEYVKIMYKAFFGREADAIGLEGWINALETNYTKEFVFAGFANSTEFGTLCDNYGIVQGEVEMPEQVIPTVTPTPEPTAIPTATPTPTEQLEFEWKVKTDGTVEIVRVKDKTITETMIPDKINGLKVTSIGSEAFFGCYNLTNIDLPDNLTQIGTYAFGSCISLACIDLPDGLLSIGASVFANSGIVSIELPDSITTIEKEVFVNCHKLTSIKLPNNLKSIEYRLFYGCDNLVNIEFPDSVLKIGQQAFYGCSSLKKIDLPDSITCIGNNAFIECFGLNSIELPDGLQSMGTYPIAKYDNLKTIIVTRGTYAETWVKENHPKIIQYK